jgi:multiple sugar transport system permease protein
MIVRRKSGFEQALPYLAPAIIILLVVLIYPLFYTVRLSFFNYSIATGFKYSFPNNYVKLFSDDKFFISLRNTLIYTFIVVSVECILGFILASILNREFRGRGLIRGLLMIPMLTSPIVSGIIWRFMYNPDFGIINYFFTSVGLPAQIWTGNVRTALLSVIIVDIWEFTPFVMLLFLAGMASIPKEQYEAAMMDGAGVWASTRYITLPWLKPMILVVLLLRTMDSIKVFDQVYALTAGGPGVASMTLSMYAYINGFRNFYLGYASTISVVLATVTIIICLFYIRSMRLPER